MKKKLKNFAKKKQKISKSINKFKNKINLKEKKLSKINIKIASLEKKVAEKKAKKIAKKPFVVYFMTNVFNQTWNKIIALVGTAPISLLLHKTLVIWLVQSLSSLFFSAG